MSDSRSRGLQLALIAVAAGVFVVLMLLVGSVNNIEFQARKAADFQYTGEIRTGSNSVALTGLSGFLIFTRLFFIVSITALILFSLINKRWRRVFLTLFIVTIAGLYLLEYILQFQGDQAPPPVAEMTGRLQIEKTESEPQPEPEYKTSGFQYVTLAIALAVLIVAIASVILVRALRTRYTPSIETFDELYEGLSEAAARIRAGEDPYEVVLFCYQGMIRLLSAKGRIDATYLTPREFEQSLQTAGLGDAHIRELTRIFEVVRYGARVDDGFGERALTCLDAIQEAHAQA